MKRRAVSRCRQDPLKSCFARDDASRLTVGKVLREVYVKGVDVLGAEVADE